MGPNRLNQLLSSRDAQIEDQVTDTIQSRFNWLSHRSVITDIRNHTAISISYRSVITDIRNNRKIRVSREFHDWLFEIKKQENLGTI